MRYQTKNIRYQRAYIKVLLVFALSVVAVFALSALLMYEPGKTNPNGEANEKLVMYCAAGIRKPVEDIARQYEEKYGVTIELQYDGSQTLLSQLQVSNKGDIYLAGDSSYTDLAFEQGLVQERIPLANIRPVLIVKAGNPKNITSLKDLLRDDVKVVLGNPEQAAIGTKTRKLIKKAGLWDQLEKAVLERGTYMPTVNEVATSLQAGNQLDVGVVWDATAAQMEGLEAIRIPELDKGKAEITVALVKNSEAPTTALKFMRYLSSNDIAKPIFKNYGFEVIEGDSWSEQPEITIFSGSVNRPAIDQIINDFEDRHDVTVNRVYNGCGILVTQMKGISGGDLHGIFPDAYLSCDIAYHEKIEDRFKPEEDVTNMRMVIVTQQGNPKGINKLEDLTQAGLKLAISNPKESALGGLTERLLKATGTHDAIQKNVIVTAATGDILVAQMKGKNLDAAIVYYANCMHIKDEMEVIQIDHPQAIALQTYAVSKVSSYPQLIRLLFEELWSNKHRALFKQAGFEWARNQ